MKVPLLFFFFSKNTLSVLGSLPLRQIWDSTCWIPWRSLLGLGVQLRGDSSGELTSSQCCIYNVNICYPWTSRSLHWCWSFKIRLKSSILQPLLKHQWPKWSSIPLWLLTSVRTIKGTLMPLPTFAARLCLSSAQRSETEAQCSIHAHPKGWWHSSSCGAAQRSANW